MTLRIGAIAFAISSAELAVAAGALCESFGARTGLSRLNDIEPAPRLRHERFVEREIPLLVERKPVAPQAALRKGRELLGEGNSFLTAIFALGVVIVAILLVLWLLKLLFNASGNVARGRNRRLAVVDSLALDPKRQLLIIRRDNVEHLILTGGPQDVVVETGIAVEEAPAAQPTRRPIPMVATRKQAPTKAAPAVPPARCR